MLAWLDIETTGLHPESHDVLEIGMILTDDRLHEMDRYSAVIQYPWNPAEMGVDPYVVEMHTKNGLWEACKKTLVRVEDVVPLFGEWLDQYPAELVKQTPLAGSTVGFDKGFLAAKPFYKPLLSRFHYRSIDVSTLKELAARWAPRVAEMRPLDRKTHRSLPDLEDSIVELRYYSGMMFKDGP